MLTIHNSLTRRKEKFVPIEAGKVRLYVCGLTTYDYVHLGHARMLVAFDVIVRHLRARGFEVTYVRNITDVDDKILERAARNGEFFADLTARFIDSMHEDEAALGILPPDQEPRATAYIPQIISMIETLIHKDYAYRTDNGDVYFAVMRFADYGRLSNRRGEGLLASARIEAGELKRDPRDFALWKSSADGDVGWDSPWGYGRPGWHIECSAMSTCTLGEQFDIHGGGSDLVFPHHENEIAQSEAATGKRFARLWMHNGPLRVDDEKMSKSLGNVFTVRDLLQQHHPEVIRYLLSASHYRSPISYSAQSLQKSLKNLERFYLCLEGLDTANARVLVNSRFERAFNAAMDDDFNTPRAFRALFGMVREINRCRKAQPDLANQLGRLLVRLGGVLGVLQVPPQEFLRRDDHHNGPDRAHIEELLARRERARASQDWKQADAIREQLAAMKVVVEDGADGSTWRVER